MVDQHLPHHTGHEGEKVSAVDEQGLSILEHFDERFVDQGRGLESMPRLLAPHERPGDSVQLAIDQRHQLIQSSMVPCAQLFE